MARTLVVLLLTLVFGLVVAMAFGLEGVEASSDNEVISGCDFETTKQYSLKSRTGVYWTCNMTYIGSMTNITVEYHIEVDSSDWLVDVGSINGTTTTGYTVAAYNHTANVTASYPIELGPSGVSMTLLYMSSTIGNATVYYVRFTGQSGSNTQLWIGIGAGVVIVVLAVIVAVVIVKKRRERHHHDEVTRLLGK